MTHPRRRWTDERMENAVGLLLRCGVTAAAAIVILGGVIYLIRHGLEAPDYRLFQGEPVDLRSLSGIIKATLEFRARGIIQLGLLVLIATPVARVFFSVFAFAVQRDRIYVIITLVVLSVLLYSLVCGGL